MYVVANKIVFILNLMMNDNNNFSLQHGPSTKVEQNRRKNVKGSSPIFDISQTNILFYQI